MDLASLKEHLCQLEKKLLEPEVRSSPLEFDALLADDFFEFGSSGNIWHKEDYFSAGGIEVRQMHLYDFEIHPLSEEAILATYKVNDRTRLQKTLRSSVWKLIDGRWQLFFHQGTIMGQGT